MKIPMITSHIELISAVNELGFLPFFECCIPGFSLGEHTPAEYWFKDGVEGPWEWKGMVLPELFYGKLFDKKAGFVSVEWLPHLMNYRRDGYDFEGFYEDGNASYKSKLIVEELQRSGPTISRALKAELNYNKQGEKGFDTVIAALQMQTFVTVKSFEYALDKHGAPYGWGLARYALPEQLYPASIIDGADCTPDESYERMLERIAGMTGANKAQCVRLLRR